MVTCLALAVEVDIICLLANYLMIQWMDFNETLEDESTGQTSTKD